MIQRYQRQCPSCSSTVTYKNLHVCNTAEKLKTPCNSCRMQRLQLSNRQARLSGDYSRSKHQKVCVNCGKTYIGYDVSRYCSRRCNYERRYVKLDPFTKKALTLGACVKFGKGKRAFFESLLRKSLETKCKYCPTVLTLENVSLDHIRPFGSIANRAKPELIKQLNVPENLQIICKPCNSLKGTLSESDFLALLTFLESHPALKEYVLKKLAQSTSVFSWKKWKHR